MWIINARTIQLEPVVSLQKASPYAILSHTWGDPPQDEITFDDIKGLDSRTLYDSKRPGWQKVTQACAKALEYNYEYIWIDTCCIDKSSSAELQEAINSMFSYYAKSAICFVYLSDVEPSHTSKRWHDEQFEQSRWFTRGWTLQELLAPAKVDFFNNSWQKLGDKIELCDLISYITGIRKIYLRGGDKASSHPATVAERMSWAAKRETTRLEDKAYCLLGLFGVYMPLLYGEGPRAFLRLQEEILRSNDDVTIHIWGMPPNHSKEYDDFDLKVENTHAENLFEHSLMAPDPGFFCNSPFGKWKNLHSDVDYESRHLGHLKPPTFIMGQRGLTVNIPLRADPKYKCLAWVFLVDVRYYSDIVAIPLVSVSSSSPRAGIDNEYWRPIWCRPVVVPSSFAALASYQEILIRRSQTSKESFYTLPFRLRVQYSDKLSSIRAYPPGPVSGDLISLCESFIYPPPFGKSREKAGRIYLGSRHFLIHITNPWCDLLIVLDYRLGPSYGSTVPFERHDSHPECACSLTCRVFILRRTYLKAFNFSASGDTDKSELHFIPRNDHRYYLLEDLEENSRESFVSSDMFLDVQLTRSQGLGTPFINVMVVTGNGMDFRWNELLSGSEGQGWNFGLGAYLASEHQKPPARKIRVHTDMGFSEEFEQEISEGDLDIEGESDARSSNKAKRWSSGEDTDTYEPDHARRRIPHEPIPLKAREENSDRNSSDHARPQLPRRPLSHRAQEDNFDRDSSDHARPQLPRRPLSHRAQEDNFDRDSSDHARPQLPRRPLSHRAQEDNFDRDSSDHARPQLPRRPLSHRAQEDNFDRDSSDHARPQLPRRPLSHRAQEDNFDRDSSDHARPQISRRPTHHMANEQSSDGYSYGDSGQEAYEEDSTEGSEECSQGGYMSDGSEQERPAGRVKRSWKSALSRFSSSNHHR